MEKGRKCKHWKMAKKSLTRNCQTLSLPDTEKSIHEKFTYGKRQDRKCTSCKRTENAYTG